MKQFFHLITYVSLSLTLLKPMTAHEHFAAGIIDLNQNGQADQGEPLQFVGKNGTNQVFRMLPRPVGQRCGGYYTLDDFPRTLFPNDYFTFTALSDGQIEAPTPLHAKTGSYIWMEITSVKGPAGATFGFWDENRALSHVTPTKSFPVNQPTNGYKFVLSEGYDDPSEDPQGHIHGRCWTADLPGTYKISFTLYDLSSSGTGGNAIHPPSQVYVYTFVAGPEFTPKIALLPSAAVKLTWPSSMGTFDAISQSGITFQVLRSSTMRPDDWQIIGSVMGTTAETVSFTDLFPPPNKAFYRLRYNWRQP